MSSRTQGLSTLYSAFLAGWLLFSHLVGHGHKMVSTDARITAPPSQLRDKKGGGKKHFLLMHMSLVIEETLSQKPQEISAGPGQNWSTGQFCLREDRAPLFGKDHDAHN